MRDSGKSMICIFNWSFIRLTSHWQVRRQFLLELLELMDLRLSNQNLSFKFNMKFSGVNFCNFCKRLSFSIEYSLPLSFSFSLFRVKVREGRIGEITEILAWYEYINDVILDHLDDEIKSTDRSGVWRYLISFKNLLRAIENIGIVSVYGIRYQQRWKWDFWE